MPFLPFSFPSLPFPPPARLAATSSVRLEPMVLPRLQGGRQAPEHPFVRPVHGRRWLWSHLWMEAGNRAALGKRLGRWFHLAAPFISLLELVEVFNVISLAFATLTPCKTSFPPPKTQTHFLGGFLVRHKQKLPIKPPNIQFLVFFPSLSVLYFSSEKEKL